MENTLIESFTVSAFKIFAKPVTIYFSSQIKNTSFMDDSFLTKEDFAHHKIKVGKVTALYGNNNSGKSCLLEAMLSFCNLVEAGSLEDYPFPLFKNFFLSPDVPTEFSLSFLLGSERYQYQISFSDAKEIDECLSLADGTVLYKRGRGGVLKGLFFDKYGSFQHDVTTLMKNRLILSYYTTYKNETGEVANVLNPIRAMISAIQFINGLNRKLPADRVVRFYSNPEKVKLINSLMKDSSFFVEQRELASQDEVLKNKKVRDCIGYYIKNESPTDDDVIASIEPFRLMSLNVGPNKQTIKMPSTISDSTGTKKFLVLAMDIIDALSKKAALVVIDEYDASLHYRLLEKLVNLMKSKTNSTTQFLIITQEVELLDPTIFRKDQVNFMDRKSNGVEIIRLSSFQTNSKFGETKIRKNTDVAGIYKRSRIVPIPDSALDEIELQKIWSRFSGDDSETETDLEVRFSQM